LSNLVVHLFRTTLGWLAASFLAPCVFAQSGVPAPPQTPPDDLSFYLNQPVVHPESLSGIWETSNGEGGAVGVHLLLMTTLPGDAAHPIWTPQSWQHLEVGVFERKESKLEFGEDNFFSDSLRGGGVTFKDDRLQLHFVSTWKDTPSVDLNLLLQPDDCWHGRFHRGAYDSVVVLCRPTPGGDAVLSPIAGTWFQTSGHGSACIHIAQTGSATFTGWSDSLMIPDQVRFGSGVPGPHQLYENFGTLAKVDVASDEKIDLEFTAYSAICCSHHFIGKLSVDGSILAGEFPPGPNQSPQAAIFTKMRGDSCVDATALHGYEPTRMNLPR
jgi:hypothetical protein